jgi:hypothetical protein
MVDTRVAPERLLDRSMREELARASRRIAPSTRLEVARADGTVVRPTHSGDLPPFDLRSRPTTEVKDHVVDVDGKPWVPLLYWLHPDAVDPVPRFTKKGLTIELRSRPSEGRVPLGALPFLPLDPAGWRATLEAERFSLSMDAHWRETDDSRYRLDLVRRFEDRTNERENLRSALLSGGITITVQWTHRIGLQKPGPAFRHLLPISFDQTTTLLIARADPDAPMWQDGPSRWKRFDGPRRRMYYRATGAPAQYELLPAEFRLGFDAARGVPAINPLLYNPKDAAGRPDEDQRRVHMSMMAVPHTDPAEREALRAWIQPQEQVELAILVPPVAIGRFEIDAGLQRNELGAPTSKTVTLDGVFWLDFDFSVSAWTAVVTQLSQPGGGVTGNVFLTLETTDGRQEINVPVALRLTELHADVLEVVPSPADVPGGRVVLRNTLDQPVRARTPTIHLYYEEDEISEPTNVRQARPRGSFANGMETLGPREEREVEVEPIGEGAPWNRMLVELDEVSIDPPTEGWPAALSVKAPIAEVAHRVTVVANNLVGTAASLPHHYRSTSVRLWPLRGPEAMPPDGRVDHSRSEWSSKMWYGLADQWARETDPARPKLYVIELQSNYADEVIGLRQRFRGESQHVPVRVLTDERPDSRYQLLDEDGTLRENDLDHATALARIQALATADESWRLRVIPPAPAPTPADPPVTDPPPSGESPAPTPAGPPLVINPVAIDFERFPQVFVTLRVGWRGQTLTNTLKFDAFSSEVRQWSPPREPGTPIAYTMVFVRHDGGPPLRMDGIEASDLLMVLPPND